MRNTMIQQATTAVTSQDPAQIASILSFASEHGVSSTVLLILAVGAFLFLKRAGTALGSFLVSSGSSVATFLTSQTQALQKHSIEHVEIAAKVEHGHAQLAEKIAGVAPAVKGHVDSLRADVLAQLDLLGDRFVDATLTPAMNALVDRASTQTPASGLPVVPRARDSEVDTIVSHK